MNLQTSSWMTPCTPGSWKSTSRPICGELPLWKLPWATRSSTTWYTFSLVSEPLNLLLFRLIIGGLARSAGSYPYESCHEPRARRRHGTHSQKPARYAIYFIHSHCNILQHTATHCNTLQHYTQSHCNTLQHTATHCNTLQHTATHRNTLQFYTQ